MHLTKVHRYLPTMFVKRLKGGTIERWYNKIRIRQLSPVRFNAKVGSFSLLLPPGTQLADCRASSKKQYEPGLVSEFADQLNSSDVFYDVGAQFGYISMIARVTGVDPENIHAFEADWFRASVLDRNHRGSGVNIIEAEVGEGDISNTLSIDEYASSEDPPTVIKIDVEGAELSVLRGAAKVLEKHHPTIYCEVHPGMVQGGTVQDIIALLEDKGYSLASKDHFSSETDWNPIQEMIDLDTAFLIRASLIER